MVFFGGGCGLTWLFGGVFLRGAEQQNTTGTLIKLKQLRQHFFGAAMDADSTVDVGNPRDHKTVRGSRR